MPYETCKRNYRRYVNLGIAGTLDQNPTQVMLPFFECISLPGFSYGIYGNCLYNVSGATCSFHAHLLKGHAPDWVLKCG